MVAARSDAIILLSIFLIAPPEQVEGRSSRLSLLFELFKEYPQGGNDNFTQLTRKFGYKSEEHTVVTKDGYILSLFRIPRGKNCQGSVKQPPVLLMHGLLTSSDSGLDAGPSAGLAYLLADACYDLWAGNIRGNYYGRRHVRLDPDSSAEFWKFSTHEMGTLDLPATIDYVLNCTKSADFMYIGYSQGCRIFFTMCSETTGYCDKARVSIHLAPAVRLNYMRSLPSRLFFEYYAAVAPVLKKPSDLEVSQKGGLLQVLLATLCKDDFLAASVCKLALSLFDSYDPGSITTDTVKVLYDHLPGGASAYNIAIYGQNIISQRFQNFDYGPSENLERYGDVQPPLYNLTRAAVPVVLMYGKNDFLADPRDVRWLSDQLPNVLETYEVARSTWNHLDNCYSQYTKQMIFPKIDQYLQKYGEKK